MNDLVNETPKKRKQGLNKRFMISAISLIVILAFLASAATYYLVRNAALEQNLNRFNQKISSAVTLQSGEGNNSPLQAHQLLGSRLLQEGSVLQSSIYSPDHQLLWRSSQNSVQLNSDDKLKLTELVRTPNTSSVVGDYLNQFIEEPSFASLLQVIKPGTREFSTLSVIRGQNGTTSFLLKSTRDYTDVRAVALQSALACFFLVLLSGLLVYFVFSRFVRKSINVINDNETILNNQVTKLSMLLEENRELQRNMKSASKRAVELNERFLRRVGADLHDGPAQSIGYSILRLNQVKDKSKSEELGFEFHAIKEALTESLDEIRGISSGLVLPELEQMTLQEATQKVIERHKMKTGVQVKETYLNLPEQVSLPIKICAYRFAQEGLNNAHKHGGAEKCRFTAQLIDDVLHLSVKDNGMGFRKSVLNTDGGHLGLAGLIDRIESLGGKLSINSELGVGTALKVTVKISDDEDDDEE